MNETMTATESQPVAPKPSPRWFQLTADRLVLGLLAVEGLLWLSEQFGWTGWRNGYAVLWSAVIVGTGLFLMLLWFVASLFLRRWFQFGIRSLVALVAVIAIHCGWLATRNRYEIHQHHPVVEAIVKDDAAVGYDFRLDASGNLQWQEGPPVGDELDRLFHVSVKFDRTLPWVEQLPNLQSLSLGTYVGTGAPPSLTDAGLAHVRGIKKLRRLQIGWTSITEAGLVHLSCLNGLEVLDMTGLRTTDACLKHLQSLTQVQVLYLGEGGENTDAGLAYLKGLTRLRILVLRGGPRITDAGLEHLTGLTQLEELDVSWTTITDAGLERLRRFPRLQRLKLGRTQVTDAGLAHLNALTGLRELDLSGTTITDAGLAHLKGLTHLRIDGCRGVTEAGIMKFREASPICRVD
jgi:hypothetical protein